MQLLSTALGRNSSYCSLRIVVVGNVAETSTSDSAASLSASGRVKNSEKWIASCKHGVVTAVLDGAAGRAENRRVELTHVWTAVWLIRFGLLLGSSFSFHFPPPQPTRQPTMFARFSTLFVVSLAALSTASSLTDAFTGESAISDEAKSIQCQPLHTAQCCNKVVKVRARL